MSVDIFEVAKIGLINKAITTLVNFSVERSEEDKRAFYFKNKTEVKEYDKYIKFPEENVRLS